MRCSKVNFGANHNRRSEWRVEVVQSNVQEGLCPQVLTVESMQLEVTVQQEEQEKSGKQP